MPSKSGKRWLPAEENRLKDLYLNTSLTLVEIGKELQRTPAAINSRLRKLDVPRRLSKELKCPKKVTPALARLHAHVCADGALTVYKEKNAYGFRGKYRKKQSRTRYVVCYTNSNEDLLQEFQRDMDECFGAKGNKWKESIKVKSKRIWKFLKEMEVGDSHTWRIPKEIRNGPKEVMKNWIRAFFDDDAHFDDKNGRIAVKCVNKEGLIQIMEILRNFVPCHLTPKEGFYWGKTVRVSINKKHTPKFFSEIGSIRCDPKDWPV